MAAPVAASNDAPDTTPEVELVARRALGAALNRLADGDRTPWIPVSSRETVARAKALLEHRVPPGPELTTAIALLDAAVPDAVVTPLP